MIANSNFLLYTEKEFNFTPITLHTALARWNTDYVVTSGQELFVLDIKYLSQRVDSDLWTSAVHCQVSSSGWRLGWDKVVSVDPTIGKGGISFLPDDTRFTVQYPVQNASNTWFLSRTLWKADNTGIRGAFITSGNWKEEEYLGENTGSAQDLSFLIGQPITIDTSGLYSATCIFYGLRIYDSFTGGNLLAEYLPFHNPGDMFEKLLNTVNGQIIDPVIRS